jgi:dTDP-glucose 4,6-dehydratase
MKLSKNKKILVTGADGFIGSHLVQTLVNYGYDVRAMTQYNSFNTWGWLDTFDEKFIKQFEILSGDIRDKKFVLDSCKNIDVIFHLASLIAIPYSYSSPYSYLSTNVEGTLNILEASLNSNIQKIIHTSTSEVYGESKSIAISEESQPIARSPYSASKIAADQLAYSYYSTYNLPVSIIRPFNTYGPRQSSRAIIPTIITQLLNKTKEIKLGSLYPTRDFTFIDDTVAGFIRMAESDNNLGEIINIGSGFEISIKDLCKLLIQLTNSNAKLKQEKTRIRPKKGEVDRLKANIKKAKKIINWKPSYQGKSGLKKGLEKTIKWFSDKNNLAKYKSNIYNV